MPIGGVCLCQAMTQDDQARSIRLFFREIPRRENAEVFSLKDIQFFNLGKNILEVKFNEGAKGC